MSKKTKEDVLVDKAIDGYYAAFQKLLDAVWDRNGRKQPITCLGEMTVITNTVMHQCIEKMFGVGGKDEKPEGERSKKPKQKYCVEYYDARTGLKKQLPNTETFSFDAAWGWLAKYREKFNSFDGWVSIWTENHGWVLYRR